MTRALVTGGAGFIGANLVDRLVDEGVAVLVVDDLSTGKMVRLGEVRRRGEVTFHQMDVRAPELAELTEGFRPDVIFHLAAQIDVRKSMADPIFDASVNVLGTINVLEAARHSDAGEVVFTSSGGATYGSVSRFPTPESAQRAPESPYGISKAVADDYLRLFNEAYGLEYVSLGLSNVYGPGQDPHGEAGVVAIFTNALLSGESPRIFGDGSQTRDYVFVEDVTDACLRAARLGGNRYLNIGTGRETSVIELFNMLRDIAGVEVEPTFVAAPPGEVQRSCLDPNAAYHQLGWEPWTSLEDGLSRTVEFFRH